MCETCLISSHVPGQWYYRCMSEQPPVIPGQVLQLPGAVTPTAVLDPISIATHKLTNVLRHMVTNMPGVFKSEGQVFEAINAINEFEKHLIPHRDRNLVGSPDDRAPVEDVTQRVPPRGAMPPPIPQAGPQIDYNALAQAIIAAQTAQPETPAPVPTQEETVNEPAGNDSTDGTTGA